MSAQPFPSSSFFGTAPPPGFDPAALLQGLAQSDLPSFVHDILANLATAAAAATVASAPSQEAGQGDAAIPPACPSSSSSSAAASKAAPLASTEISSSSSARRPRCVPVLARACRLRLPFVADIVIRSAPQVGSLDYRSFADDDGRTRPAWPRQVGRLDRPSARQARRLGTAAISLFDG